MADAPVVHIGENSPEYIAYKLFLNIAQVEKRTLNPAIGAANSADREFILRTYAQCLRTVYAPHTVNDLLKP